VSSELKTNKISPATGTALTLADSGDTLTLPSGATLDIASGATISNSGTASGFGKIVQCVQTTSTTAGSTAVTLPSDTSIPQNTEGYELMTLAITPTSASNKLLITSIVHMSANSGPYHTTLALFQDSTADALAVADDVNDGANYLASVNLRYWMTAGTTSSTTFKIRVGSNIGTCYFGRTSSYDPFCGGVLQHNLTITEYAV